MSRPAWVRTSSPRWDIPCTRLRSVIYFKETDVNSHRQLQSSVVVSLLCHILVMDQQIRLSTINNYSKVEENVTNHVTPSKLTTGTNAHVTRWLSRDILIWNCIWVLYLEDLNIQFYGDYIDYIGFLPGEWSIRNEFHFIFLGNKAIKRYSLLTGKHTKRV